MTEEEIEKQAKQEFLKNKRWIDGAKWGMEHATQWNKGKQEEFKQRKLFVGAI